MLLARLEDNTVMEIVDLPDDIDPQSAFHPSIRLVAVTPDVKPGATWDGSTFENAPEIPDETRLPKDVLKMRAHRYCELLLETATLKVGARVIGIDVNILTALTVKILLIDQGIVKQPVQFRLADGSYAPLLRGDLADLQKAISAMTEKLAVAAAALIVAIDKGQISTQQQIEAAFPISVGDVPLPGGVGQ